MFGALGSGGEVHVWAGGSVETVPFFGKNVYVAILCLFYIRILLLLHGLHTLKQARNVEAVNIIINYSRTIRISVILLYILSADLKCSYLLGSQNTGTEDVRVLGLSRVMSYSLHLDLIKRTSRLCHSFDKWYRIVFGKFFLQRAR